jgi:hypothetical protein
MDTREYTSEAEIDKAFSDHIESLKLSGLPYDHVGLMASWVEAVAEFKENQTKDYTSL